MTLPATDTLIPLLVLIPFVGAMAVYFLPVRLRDAGGIATALVVAACVLLTTIRTFADGAHHHDLGGWEPPLGISLHLDGLGAVFLCMTACIGVPVSFYARSYFRLPEAGTGGNRHFWPLWLFLWGGLNGMYLSADLFNLYVLIEVASLAAVSLTVLSGKAAARVAGLRYLLAAIAGSMAYLMGVALVYGSVGALDFGTLARELEPSRSVNTGFALILVGLLLKTALFPLHFWLPGAHASAQPPVSAILSALVIKGTFFLIMRLWVDVFDASVTYAAGQMMGILGSAAILWGSYQALHQRGLKKVIAHSTVGQIGYLFLLFPLISVTLENGEAAPWAVHAWTGGIYQALAHGFAKASMFLVAGIYILAIGNDRLQSMSDLVGRLPMTTFALALSGVSLIGLPPSGGFVAKWMLLKAALSSGQWWWAPVVVAGSFLTAGYVFMILRQAFAPSEGPRELHRVPRALEITALLLGIGSIVIGLRAEEVLLLLDVGAPFGEVIEVEEGGAQ